MVKFDGKLMINNYSCLSAIHSWFRFDYLPLVDQCHECTNKISESVANNSCIRGNDSIQKGESIV